MRVAGVMSGTSLDGIDVAIVDIRGREVQTKAFASTPYPAKVRDAILAVSNTTTTTEVAMARGTRRSRISAASSRRRGAPRSARNPTTDAITKIPAAGAPRRL